MIGIRFYIILLGVAAQIIEYIVIRRNQIRHSIQQIQVNAYFRGEFQFGSL
jgi:hypothetical protein